MQVLTLFTSILLLLMQRLRLPQHCTGPWAPALCVWLQPVRHKRCRNVVPPLPPFALLPFFFCFPLGPRDSSPNPSSLKDIRLVSSKKKKKKASLMPWGEHAGTNLESVKQGTRFLCCSPVCFCHSVEGYVKHCLWTYHFITGNPFCSALLTCQNYFSITSQVYNDLCTEGWAGILTISLTGCEYLLWSLFPERDADLFSICLFSLPQ